MRSGKLRRIPDFFLTFDIYYFFPYSYCKLNSDSGLGLEISLFKRIPLYFGRLEIYA